MNLSRALSFLAVLVTFCLLIVGGIVHNTGSSLACPDWPTCYGEFFPVMEGGILIEHGHRILGTIVGFLTVLILLSVYFRKDQKNKSLGWKLLGMVIVQGLLGGVTVIYQLPTIVSTSHLALSLIFFSSLIYFHHESNHKKALLDPDYLKKYTTWNPSIREGVLISFTLLFMQIVLGAFIRHSGVGVACGLGPDSLLLCTTKLEQGLHYTWWPANVQGQLHMLHRYMAVLVALFITFTSTRALYYTKRDPHMRFFLLSSIGLVFLQIFLGVLVIQFHIGPISTTAHLAVGALTLLSVWKSNLYLKDVESHYYPNGVNTLLKDLLDLTKPRLGSLVLMTTCVGIVSAPGHINFFYGVGTVFFTALVVGGACALNCYLEREVDKKMNRTQNRPLPDGRLSPLFALAFGLFCVLVGTIGIFKFINSMTGYLAIIATIFYLFVYTPMKKYSPWAVAVGAVPGAIPPLMGHTAVTGSIDVLGVLLFAILFFWQLPHFLAISLYYDDEYKLAEIKIFPHNKGKAYTKWNIFIYTCILCLVSFIPMAMDNSNKLYQLIAYGGGAFLLVLALYGLSFAKSERGIRLWARQYFYASLFYLPSLLGAMVFLK